MRSSTAAKCFPYGSPRVCFMELFPDGELKQLTTRQEKVGAYIRASMRETKIVAVRPGQWRSDLFIVDDLDAFCEKQELL